MSARWEVFENPDADIGGWISYIENHTNYLGGEWHASKAAAEAYAQKVAAEYNNSLRPLPEPPSAGPLFFFYEPTEVKP